MSDPVFIERDARERAIRSFLWGLLIDVSTGVTLVLLMMIGDLQWTKTYWITLGLAIAKSAAQAIVAYLGRKLIKPQSH